MMRYALAALLAAPALAFGQESGPAEFQPIFNDSMGAVFPLDLDAIVGEHNAAVEVPLRPDAANLEGDTALLQVEGEGVRLPDEQFSLD